MGCMDDRYFGFTATNDREELHKFGYLDDDYPGCGSCPDCCYYAKYDRDTITQNQAKAEEWHRNHPHLYTCKWSCGEYYGYFDLRSSSLEAAREIAQRSFYPDLELLGFVVSPVVSTK